MDPDEEDIEYDLFPFEQDNYEDPDAYWSEYDS